MLCGAQALTLVCTNYTPRGTCLYRILYFEGLGEGLGGGGLGHRVVRQNRFLFLKDKRRTDKEAAIYIYIYSHEPFGVSPENERLLSHGHARSLAVPKAVYSLKFSLCVSA